MINRDRLVKTFCDLVRIDSPSGEEEAVAQELIKRLEGMGLNVQRDDYGNLVANDGGDNPITLSAHMDTVEPGRGIQPLVERDRIVSDGTTILGGDCPAAPQSSKLWSRFWKMARPTEPSRSHSLARRKSASLAPATSTCPCSRARRPWYLTAKVRPPRSPPPVRPT